MADAVVERRKEAEGGRGDLPESPQVSEMTSVETESGGTESGEDGDGEEESSAMSVGALDDAAPLATMRRRRSTHFKSVDSRSLLRDDMPANTAVEEKVVVSQVDVARNRTLRASSPAHRRNKESPLSSDAIWHQVSH
jgi:hypothetical protein